GALSYDKQTNTMWAGNFNGYWGSDDGTYQIYHIDMTGQVLETIPYNNGTPQYVFNSSAYPSKCGGVTVDYATDTLFVMPYFSAYVIQISKTGQYIGNFPVGSIYASGVSYDGKDLYVLCPLDTPSVIKKFTTAGQYLKSIPLPTPPDGVYVESEYDTQTFAPKCALWLIDSTWTRSVLQAVEVDYRVDPRTQAINDMIESVALEQTAVSHILNAEGEKIQKLLKLEDILQTDILAVNNSVNSMVGSVTVLESIFRDKLTVFNSGSCTLCLNTPSDGFRNGSTFSVLSAEAVDANASTEYTSCGLKRENIII
ncbi:MAG: hypothetical protein RSF82_01810, partial [Angelakisella sp.]